MCVYVCTCACMQWDARNSVTEVLGRMMCSWEGVRGVLGGCGGVGGRERRLMERVTCVSVRICP